MKKPLALVSALLVSTCLTTPALAQSGSGAPVQTGPSTTGPAAQTGPQTGPATAADPEAATDPATGEPAEQEIEVSAPGAQVTDEIIVTGNRRRNVLRQAPQVVSVLSTEDIARTGEGDIAGALQRVTGLSVVGSGLVYVRGLGDRYSLSLLNGSPLPSPDPLRRVVPLDIFPTNIIASALVQKSYSPNYPGEFGGGVINLTTQATPNETFIAFDGSVGGDTITTDNLGYTYYGSDTDWLGFDDGTRDVPDFVRSAGENGATITPEQATQLVNAPTTLLQKNKQIQPNWSLGFNAGTSVNLGAGVELGIIAAAAISNSWRTRDALQQTSDATGRLETEFQTVLTDNRVLVNGLLGIGLEVGDHRLRLTNVYIHDAVKQGRLSSGFDVNNAPPTEGQPDPLLVQNTFYFERELYDLQGVAELRFGSLSADIRGTYAKTKRDSPYERGFSYAYNPLIEDYQNSLSGGNETASIGFSELDETVYGAGADLSYRLPTAIRATVTGGYAFSENERNSTRYFFRYRGRLGNRVDPVTAQLRPDFLISDFSIITNGINLVPEAALGATEYDASLRVHAGYLMAEVEPIENVRVQGGVRYEDAVQTVATDGGFLPTRLNNDYWLPALTVTWELQDNMQLRLHGSKTIARPQFRELAPQLFQDFESDRQFFGNPLLTDSELLNAEARYEWFFGRDQRLTAAAFYKKIDNPIEAVVTAIGETTEVQTGFSNAPQADLYGVELELQRYFPLESLGSFFATRRLLVIGNYTYTKSELKVGDELVPDPIQPNDPTNQMGLFIPASLIFESGAPLTGQSDHLVNLQLGIEDTDRLSQFTLLFTYASNRVTNRGGVQSGVTLPDLIEEPGIRLDFVARQGVKIGRTQAELKFEARNLTGTGYRERIRFDDETTVDINRYDVGTSFSIGLGVRF